MLDTSHFCDKWNAIHQYLQNRNDYPFAYKENWYNLVNRMNKIWIVFWQISTYDQAGKKWNEQISFGLLVLSELKLTYITKE
jgi:hypothetical protein